jgi:peptidoglycan/xylan/chitin deacetylase (PgdA/CDA1 family)
MRSTSALLFVVLLLAWGCGGEDEAGPPAAPTTAPVETEPCIPDETAPAPQRPAPPPPTQPPVTTTSAKSQPPEIPPTLVGREWEVLPTSRKVVALTFDCGANAAGVRSIVRTLRRTRTPATFFLTGRWAQAFPALAAELGDRYPIGNHTLTHPDLTALDDAAVRAEIRRAGRVLARTTGRDPRPLFRFPYGARDERTIALANELGYGGVRWTVDTLGWQGTAAGRSAESVRARVLAALRPGAIVLMHVGAAPDGSTLDADALPAVIAAVQARGYRLVGLAGFVD